tara:strand:+ start:585 stop:1052 length:468 start_codon:yes stop_codon:yes gene_type:complete
MVSDPNCPCCNSTMEMHGDAVGGHLHYCAYCYGMLTSDRWLVTNIDAQVLRRMKTAVFNGEDAIYSCPTCEGGMVKGPVPTSRAPIEVDGCLKCGSLWFDNREIEPFFPDFRDLAIFLDNDPAPLFHFTEAKLVFADLFGAISSITRRKRDDSEE